MEQVNNHVCKDLLNCMRAAFNVGRSLEVALLSISCENQDGNLYDEQEWPVDSTVRYQQDIY